MATTQYSPQLRPLGVGEVLDASFKIVRQNFGTLALCVLVVALPLNIISTLITASTSENAFDLDTATGDEVGTGTEVAGTLVTGALSIVLTSLAAAACYRAVSSIYLGERPTVGESLSFAASRLLPVIVLSIIYFLALIPAFLALIIPGIWLAVAWSLSFPALLSERLGPVAALGRSFRLVKGRWWPTFGALLVMYLIVAVISGILGAIFGASLVGSSGNEALAATIYTIVNTVSSLITLPLIAAVVTVIYFDQRVRKEGFDLHLLAHGVGREATAHDTSAEAVGAASGLGGGSGEPGQGGGFSPPSGEPAQGGGFSPPSGEPAQGGGFSPPSGEPAQGGGFAPPQAPAGPAPSGPRSGEPGTSAPQQGFGEGGFSPPQGPGGSTPPPSAPPPSGGGLQSGDPLSGGEPPPERREGDGGAGS